MFAALAHGVSQIRNLSRGADVASTRSLFTHLGVVSEGDSNSLTVFGKGLQALAVDGFDLDCGNSGTTLRLMMGILAGSSVHCRLSGDASLNRRPVKRVITPLSLMGADLSATEGADTPPVTVRGRSLHGISYVSPVSSAQVKSAVLLAAMTAEGDTEYAEPTLSRDHTERFLASQGAKIAREGVKVKLCPPVQLRPLDYAVPGDISSATFFIVAALLLPGSELVITNVLLNDTRTGALDILRAMGARIDTYNIHEYFGEPVGDIHVVSLPLKGIDAGRYEAARFIDEIPILAVAAMFAEGETVFRKVGELRVKESDRAQGIVDVLHCYGCRAELSGDDLRIEGGTSGRSSTPDALGDHRLAMSIEIAELATRGAVLGAFRELVSISAPEFYSILEKIVQ